MEGFAGWVSAVPDMSQMVSEVGKGWYVGQNIGSIGKASEGTGRDRRYRKLYRWHVCTGKKRGNFVGKTKRGKGSKIMAIADSSGIPVACCVTSATPHEVKLVERTIENRFITEKPDNLIGDKAYDSDPLDKTLAEKHDIELIAPHRSNKKEPTQDGRKLRRYKRRWKIERLFAWLYNFRRIVTRYEVRAENFLGMVKLGCIIILMRYL